MSSGKPRLADAAVSRRAALAALSAVVAGAAAGAAPASAGPAPKQSIFGYGGASSPFSYADNARRTGTVLYKVCVSVPGEEWNLLSVASICFCRALTTQTGVGSA